MKLFTKAQKETLSIVSSCYNVTMLGNDYERRFFTEHGYFVRVIRRDNAKEFDVLYSKGHDVFINVCEWITFDELKVKLHSVLKHITNLELTREAYNESLQEKLFEIYIVSPNEGRRLSDAIYIIKTKTSSHARKAYSEKFNIPLMHIDAKLIEDMDKFKNNIIGRKKDLEIELNITNTLLQLIEDTKE